MPTAIVGNANRSVVPVAGTRTDNVFDRLLQTLRLE